ncbi:MAG: metal-sulfur cluster assembly factor [Bacteroidetes bacterium]|nr:metal-sulfur cluster assembly factor [Bacteroidota bacterium]
MIISAADQHFDQKTKAQAALYQVIDPELFVNVIDLGLIYEIEFKENGAIDVLMTLSTPHCPMGDAITNGVKNALEAEFPGKNVNINLTFNPPWNFAMLTPSGKEQLGV